MNTKQNESANRPRITAFHAGRLASFASRPAAYSAGVTLALLLLGGARPLCAQTSNPPVITNQPASQTVVAGASVTFSVGAGGTTPLSYQWRQDGLPLIGATSPWWGKSGVQGTNAGRYDVVVTNLYGRVTSAVAVLTVNTADSLGFTADGSCYAAAMLPDSTILVGGTFASMNNYYRYGLARIWPDGSFDNYFSPMATNGVNCLAVQADGKMLVGGAFTNLAGTRCTYLGRINLDGSLDSTFHPAPSAPVNALVLQPDGKILVGGTFTNLAGQPWKGVGRLNPDGTADPGFTCGGANGSTAVFALALQSDGKIVVGGGFSQLDGQPRLYLGRLNGDGTIDTSFNINPSYQVFCLAVQADDGILVGGGFSSINSQTHQGLARLNANGSLDTSFTPGAGSGGMVYSLAVQANGAILVGGSFTSLGGQPRSNLGRLNADGSVDPTFNPGASSTVRSLALQPDGQILVGGDFTSLCGVGRNRFGRLNNTVPATQSLTVDSSSITWLRGGSSPEVSGVTFDVSPNGTDWISLGTAQRYIRSPSSPTPVGWQLDGVTIGSNVTLRARGQATGGRYNGSGWLVETGIGPAAISRQPSDAVARSGSGIYVSFNVAAVGTPPFTYQWFRDGVPLPGATNAWLTGISASANVGRTYEVVVCNALGCVKSQPARVWRASADTFNPRPDGPVYALALQPDGKILMGGSFTNIAGQKHQSLARLNADGSLDTSFSATAGGGVLCLAVQSDGKIIVGGAFSTLAGQTRPGLGRLNPDGSLDTGFTATPLGPSGYGVQCLALQPDGMILVGGMFTKLAGQDRTFVGRLYPDGTVDPSFVPPIASALYQSGVFSLSLHPDGTIWASGSIPISSRTTYYVEQLNSDGSLVKRLLPATLTGGYNTINASVVQPDGKVILGGFPFIMTGISRTLVRLNADGSVDTSFNTWPSFAVTSLALQADGKILIGGVPGLIRFNADGSPDSSFDAGSVGDIYSLALQSDGKILAGGSFSSLGGATRSCLARLNNTGPVTDSISYDGSAITWLRSGPGPELLSTTFEVYADAVGWLSAGPSTRIPGGWQVSGIFVSLDYTFRGSGQVSGAGVSTWPVQTVSSLPTILTQPTSLTNNVGTPAGFRVVAAGSTPLGYQWFVNGVPLTNGNGIAGARTATLLLNSVSSVNAGNYSVVVSNLFGSVTSTAAGLRLIDPLIIAQPININTNPGKAVAFSVIANGTPPLNYQWRKDGLDLMDGGNISGTHGATLTLSNVLGGDTGSYSVVVSNAFGVLTSQAATLSVPDPIITWQPLSWTEYAGSPASFSVTVLGTPPLSYQWRKGTENLVDGGNISGARSSTLAFTSVLGGDAGAYSVVASSARGSLTSQVATLTVIDPIIIDGPNSPLCAVPGQTVRCDFTIGGTLPLYYHWRKDGTALAWATASSLVLTNVQLADAAFYDVVVSNSFGAVTSPPVGLVVSVVSLDSFNPNPSGEVETLALQAEGKILVGGNFSNVAGQTRSYFARLNPDGSLDSGFDPKPDSSVLAAAIQADGKTILAGYFDSLGGQNRNSLGRLNPDGSVDPNFHPEADLPVYSMAVQADGTIVVGGSFAQLAGQPCNRLGLLATDGLVDITFNPGANDTVYTLAAQADGKILVGGSFWSLGGQTHYSLGRLNTNGAVDTTFYPAADYPVYAVAVQADGKILVGGGFFNLAQQPCRGLGRLNPDGSLDTTFKPGLNGWVQTLSLQANGSILVGGWFTMAGGKPCSNIARLHADGTFDSAFSTWVGGGNAVDALAVQADGKILAGGAFTNAAGQPRNYIARFNNTEPATQSLALNGSTITWLRGGASPEVWRTTFDCSTNGTDWLSLGAGSRISGGWQLAGASVPTNSTIRARGFVSGSRFNGSTWFVESTLTAAPRPVIVANDSSFGVRSNLFGFNLRAAPGQAVVIEASTDFARWTPIQTNLITSLGQFLFADPATRAFPRRFYRARLYQGVLPPPAILFSDGAGGFTGGRFGFNLAGIAGQTVVIETSTDLAHWAALATNTLDSAPLYFSDPGSTNASRRFYRGRLQ